MTDAEQAISEEFGPQIGACERLYEYAKGLTTDWPGRLIENTSEGLILTLFARSLDTSADHGDKTPEYQPGAARITLERYTHVLPGELEHARERLNWFIHERT